MKIIFTSHVVYIEPRKHGNHQNHIALYIPRSLYRTVSIMISDESFALYIPRSLYRTWQQEACSTFLPPLHPT